MSTRRLGLFNKPSAGGYLLDTYTNAIHGYSLRKLKSSAIYACKIRRASDDATTDIELESSGSITLSSTVSAGGTLGTWIGANDGFVHTWYDQSGNSNDGIQTVTTNQPKLITTGTIEVQNSKPSISFASISAWLNCGTPLIGESNVDLYLLQSGGSSNLRSVIINNRAILNGSSLVLGLTAQDGTVIAVNSNFGTPSYYHNSALATTWVNRYNVYYDIIADGNQHIVVYQGGDMSSSLWDAGLALSGYLNFEHTGYIQEYISFKTDESSNRADIEININNFYSIY